jgi:vacuolar-type H+-ATPase subunit E/Vma4
MRTINKRPVNDRNVAMEQLLQIRPRFMRSVHLERDLSDASSSQGYILTPVATSALTRICVSFSGNSTQRAFRVAGDYGSGKSAFGLALARVSAGYVNTLPKELRAFCGRNRMYPHVATGDHEPLGVTVLRALGIQAAHTSRPSTSEVLTKTRKAIEAARKKGFKGVLLVLDELGKNLEFAAQKPESDDIFLLQRLAEEAARSGAMPFVIVVMLHQGVATYASGLHTTARREWDKVAGRFEEIVYAHPLEQLVTLVSATLNVRLDLCPRAIADEARESMASAVRAGIYGSAAASSLGQFGPRIFPFHPTVLPVLVRAMRKFGQNERSLFSFISAFEPMGLQQHIQSTNRKLEPYRIFHLFEYVRQNLLPAINASNSHIHWSFVESLLSGTPLNTAEEENVFRVVALLTLLDSPDLAATSEFVHLALDDGENHRAISKAIAEMKNRGLLYERGSSKTLCLWPHTSVNLDEAFARGELATRNHGDSIDLLCKQLPPEQIVPRGHYFRSGTLRYGDVRFVAAGTLYHLLDNQPVLDGKGADIHLRVVLPANQSQFREADKLLRDRQRDLAEGLFITIAQPPSNSLAALSDLVTWQWVQENTPALAGDRYAREEVARQVARAERYFRERLAGLDNLELPIGDPKTWLSVQGEAKLKPGRELLQFLSEQCDRIYSKAPRVLNELVNRRYPSSAAVAARTKLAEAMATAPDKPQLGMDDSKRPPEMALYLSILKKGGFHTENNGSWSFNFPTHHRDACNLLPAMKRITQLLQKPGIDAMVPVNDIFAGLSEIPYGIREGLQPFILAIYLATNHQRVALYEDGTFLPEVRGEVFMRLMKEPQFFHVQYCEIDGVRADVFSRLLRLLQIDPRDAERMDLIDLVRPLTIFISREVPDYSRKTNMLSSMAVSLRRALLDARDPVKLVFTLLPQACGLQPIGKEGIKDPEELALRLRRALHEIRVAYPGLISRLEMAIFAAFDIDKSRKAKDARGVIAARAAQLAAVLSEPVLKAFVIRVADTALDDKAWVESIANLLSRKSCERWVDGDETEFHHQLEIAAGRFKRTELARIGTSKRLNGHACRIALTKSDGKEVGDLINWEGMDESKIRPVEGQIQQLLVQHGRHGLAAALRAIWTQLDADDRVKGSKTNG